MPQDDTHSAAAARFTMDLGRALHTSGVPTHRLEDVMNACATRFGIGGQFFSLPTSITAGFGPPDAQHVWLVRTEPGRVNLEVLILLDDIFESVIHGAVTPQDGSAAIARVMAAPVRWSAPVRAIAFMLASAASALFLGGGGEEFASAAATGFVVGLIALATQRRAQLDRVFEPLAATVVAFLTVSAAHFVPGLNYQLATTAGLIGLVPGFTLTVAMTELATRQLVAGTTRLMGAILLFLTIGFGTAVGNRLGHALWEPNLPIAAGVQSPWLPVFALVPAALAFLVIFSARPRDALSMLVSCAVAYIGSRLGVVLLGPALGVAVGAFLVGVVGYAYSRIWNRPSSVMLVPGIMLLVPGSVGFRSVAFLLEESTVVGLNTAFSMLLSAVALVTGLLVASVVVPPRRAL